MDSRVHIKTLGDVLDAIIDRAKLGKDETTRQGLVEKVNTAHQRICFEKPYRWSGMTRAIVLKAKYSTGTATFTNASHTVTGVATAWTAAMEGRKIRKTNESDEYKILRVNSATSITLDAPYVATTAAGSNYLIYQDEYGLFPDLQDIRSVRIASVRGKIEPVGPQFIDERRGVYPAREGNPRFYTINGSNYYASKTWATFLINTDFWEDNADEVQPRNKNLIFWPGVFTTDLLARVRYTRIVAPMSLEEEEPLIPYENRYRLVLDVLTENFAKERDFVTKREWERMRMDYMKQMAGDIETTDDDLILQVDRTRDRTTLGYVDYDLRSNE